jgi:hypothetical protein
VQQQTDKQPEASSIAKGALVEGGKEGDKEGDKDGEAAHDADKDEQGQKKYKGFTGETGYIGERPHAGENTAGASRRKSISSETSDPEGQGAGAMSRKESVLSLGAGSEEEGDAAQSVVTLWNQALYKLDPNLFKPFEAEEVEADELKRLKFVS